MKIYLVVHRYGRDIAGGSEFQCREFALRLSDDNEVTVLTSCAKDYITWANDYPPGEETDGNIKVRRFLTSRKRNPGEFAVHSSQVFTGMASEAMENKWFELNGPCMPDLLNFIKDNANIPDIFLFFSYRYYQSFFGLPLVSKKSVLVPTAEEDPAIRLKVLKNYFRLPVAIVYESIEERELIKKITGGYTPPGQITGCGIPEPGQVSKDCPFEKNMIPRRFFLYLGRVDPNKGCRQMFDYYTSYAQECAEESLPLIIAGKSVMPVPEHPGIRYLGYISDGQREWLLSKAEALIMPSFYESLSLVILESWNYRRPVLVNASCKVLKGQARRSDGGLYYENYMDFAECLKWFANNPETASILGEQGFEYVEREYRWPAVMKRLKKTLETALEK